MIKRMSSYDSIKAFITKDGSVIREYMHPDIHKNKEISVAEARLAPGRKTLAHRHESSEEIYVILAGSGWMQRGDNRFAIEKGMTVAILPGEVHALENSGTEDLVILCCCAPPYSDADTRLLE